MRQIVLDTETTGLEPSQGHRIIEIGCVELVNRRLTGNHYHVYINPERKVDAGALEVHGITDDFLKDKAVFASVVEGFIGFVNGAELIIHNAPFDIGFLDSEISNLNQGYKKMDEYCKVLDSLVMARKKHPGQKNNLDALCKRYFVDNTQRELHGALLDAEILADVFLLMTGGQSSLGLGDRVQQKSSHHLAAKRQRLSNRKPLRVIRATEEELENHQQRLEQIDSGCENGAIWLK